MEKEQSPLASRSMKARVPGHEVLATGQGDSNGLNYSVSAHNSYPESSDGHDPREVRVWRPFVSIPNLATLPREPKDCRINQRPQQPP
jgi:hypothetical protein